MDNELKNLLDEAGLTDYVYEAMQQNDMSQVVTAATEALKKIGSIPLIVKQSKCEKMSTDHRFTGNEHYKRGEYRKALECYNLALKYAPKNSNAMKLAYSNRSAVLFAVEAFNACLRDIETCSKMNCSKTIIDKLEKRQRECYARGIKELSRDLMFVSDEFANKFFKFDVKRNARVPCASTDVDVVFESGKSKVVASKYIQIGTVVALEQAYVSCLSKDNYNLSCFYCHKMAFTLVPCEGCCAALFCNMDCRDRCMKEFHRIECQIVDYIDRIYRNPVNELVIKAAIKFSLKCKSWQEFITASFNIGASRIKNSTINEIYDVNNKFSILNFNTNKQFIHGRMFNSCFVCAAVLSCLSRVPNYFPQSSQEKKTAMQAFSKIMMHLFIWLINKTDIITSAYDYRGNEILMAGQINYGWFSFASKLKHACEPNLLVVGLNNKVALVALKPIERGEELNISYIVPWYDYDKNHELNYNHRRTALFAATEIVCRCRVCEEHWDRYTAKERSNLNEKQKKCHEDIISVNNRNESSLPIFRAACRGLGGLSGLENTKQHLLAYLTFRTRLNLFQTNETDNVTITYRN